MSDYKTYVVIFAGGVGSRMRSKDLPKQFLKVHDRPIIVRTIEHFQKHPDIDQIIVVSVESWSVYCRDLMSSYGLTKVTSVVPGGATGQESIYKGLLEAERLANSEPAIVLIHDGVRPLINAQLISDNIASVTERGSAITCVACKETVLELEGGQVQNIPNRSSLKLARAPQSFWLADILDAHRKAIAEGRNDFIDSASIMMHYGHQLALVDGPDENIKVTTPDDFFSVQAILNAKENEQIYSA